MNRRILAYVFLLFGAAVVFGAVPDALAQSTHAHANASGSIDEWFALLEIPFLLGCIVFAFLTARALKGGIFGTGMLLLAWGFLVMALGHLHMQIEGYTGFSLFNSIFGKMGGSIVWMIALTLTWGLSGAAFFRIYQASK